MSTNQHKAAAEKHLESASERIAPGFGRTSNESVEIAKAHAAIAQVHADLFAAMTRS